MLRLPPYKDILHSLPVEQNQTCDNTEPFLPSNMGCYFQQQQQKKNCFLGFLLNNEYACFFCFCFFFFLFNLMEEKQALQNKTSLNICSWRKIVEASTK